MKAARIGIFGGSFNPVHHGHLLAARAAKESLGLDEVVFVPCNQSAYKKKLLPGSIRLKMLRAALKGMRGFRVDGIELGIPGVSRSIDTIRAMKAASKQAIQYYLLIGEDQVSEFPRWKEAEQLSKLAKVCVMARPPYRKQGEMLRNFDVKVVPIPQLEISSTEIRKRLKRGLPIDWMLPSRVMVILRKSKTGI